MKKEIVSSVSLGIFLLLIMFISGCEGIDISKLSDEDLDRIAKEVIVCDKPYIRHATDCCLDTNDNAICDEDETRLTDRETPSGVTPPVGKPPIEPTSPKEELTCEEMEQPARDNCLYDEVIESENGLLCNKITDEKIQEKCYLEISYFKEQPNICPDKLKDKCYAKLGFSNKDLEMCEKISLGNELRGQCIYEIASSENDPSYCEKISIIKWKETCTSELGYTQFKDIVENSEKYVNKEITVKAIVAGGYIFINDIDDNKNIEIIKDKEGYTLYLAPSGKRNYDREDGGFGDSKSEFIFKGIYKRGQRTYPPCEENCERFYLQET